MEQELRVVVVVVAVVVVFGKLFTLKNRDFHENNPVPTDGHI